MCIHDCRVQVCGLCHDVQNISSLHKAKCKLVTYLMVNILLHEIFAVAHLTHAFLMNNKQTSHVQVEKLPEDF